MRAVLSSAVFATLAQTTISVIASAAASPASTPMAQHVARPEYGEVWCLDIDLSNFEAVRFILQRAAAEMAAKGVGTLVVAALLAGILLRYGPQLWRRFTKTDISTRGIKVGIALLLPLAFASHVVSAVRDFEANRIPEVEIARWKFGTDDYAKLPKHIEHAVEIPR